VTSKTDVAGTIRTLLHTLLEKGRVDGVFALRKTSSPGRYCYSLISDPSMLEEVVEPFFPVMPVQGARALAALTGTDPLRKPIIALLRPCELRACIELQKQSQLSLENVHILSCSCPGVFPAASLIGDQSEELLSGYNSALSNGEIPEGVRNACRSCTSFTPSMQVDMTVIIASDSESDRGTICLQTEWAIEVAEGIENCSRDFSQENIDALVTGLSDMHSSNKREIMESSVFSDGLDGMISLFARCTGCGGCRAVCPVCHCVLCDYSSDNTDLNAKMLSAELSSRGALRIPDGTIRFHLGRLNHISSYCVSCGQCTEACPAGIPVADIFIRASNAVQERLEYKAGTDDEGEPALSTFREVELEGIDY